MKKFFGLIITLIPALSWAQSLPEASLRVTPSVGDLTTTFVLDASDSQAAQGFGSRLEYQFKTSSKALRSSFQASPVFQFRPAEAGTFNAQLWVRDTSSGSVTTTYQRYSVRQETQRDIRISVSNLTPKEGENVTYTVTVFGNNLDRNQIQVRWDFNSDGRWETSLKRDLTATFPAVEGSSEPTVEVVFPDGLRLREKGLFPVTTNTSRSNTRQRLSISTRNLDLKAPVLEIHPSSSSGTENTIFTFDGSNTLTSKDSYLEWVIEGRTIKNQEKITYKFKSSGKKTVILKHCSLSSNEACRETSTSIEIRNEVNDQYLDITWFNVTDRGRGGQNLDYARISSTDKVRFTVRPQGQPSSNQRWRYRWDFDGDGTYDTNFSDKPSAEYTFNEVGTFVAVVEAIPSITTTNFTSLVKALPIYVERNRAPQGEFNFRQDNNYVGEKVYYTAEASDPQSGNVVEVRFDSDADGVWDSDFRRQLSWWWVYDVPGDYNVRMQLRDPQGRVHEVKRTMTILPMVAPKTAVTVSHRSQVERTTIQLDASASQGRALTYEWKVRGQSKVKLQGARTSLRLPAGDYTICLTIRDRLGVEDTVEFPVSFVVKENLVTKQAQPPTEASPNLLRFLPGAPSINNYVLPSNGVPRGPSPFVVEAGTAIPGDGYVSGMRPGR